MGGYPAKKLDPVKRKKTDAIPILSVMALFFSSSGCQVEQARQILTPGVAVSGISVWLMMMNTL